MEFHCKLAINANTYGYDENGKIIEFLPNKDRKFTKIFEDINEIDSDTDDISDSEADDEEELDQINMVLNNNLLSNVMENLNICNYEMVNLRYSLPNGNNITITLGKKN